MSKEMTEIKQKHEGIGDNVAGNKQTNNNNAPVGISGARDVYVEKLEVNNSSLDILGVTIDIGKPLKDCTAEDFEKIEKLLSMAAQRPVKIEFSKEGSIKLFLSGSQEGLQRLANLQAEGKLEELLNELKPDGMPEIKVKNAEFTEDEKVIQKAELIKDIREGKADKKHLIEANLSGADLSGADLNGAYLSGADLRGTNLNRADLREANFYSANLRGANFYRANLRGANLSGADLNGTNLIEANLIEANLIMTYLSRADLSRAKLIEADLSGAYLNGAKIDEKTQLDHKWCLVHDIVNNDLENRDLQSQNLSFANLKYSFLFRANLIGTDLTDSYLQFANLQEADLSGSNLTDANLENSNLIDAVFDHAIVKGAKFGNNEGITEGLKRDLIARGAIFADDFGAGDRVLTRV